MSQDILYSAVQSPRILVDPFGSRATLKAQPLGAHGPEVPWISRHKMLGSLKQGNDLSLQLIRSN